MIKLTLTLLAAIGFFHAGNALACDERASRLVAKTYVLAIPVLGRENEIIPLVQSNPHSFNHDGNAIRCMRRLGAAFTKSGVSQFQNNKQYSAVDRFSRDMPPGLEHLPGQVDDSMNSYAGDIYSMGQELLWLARVLPNVVNGSYTAYNSTGTDTRKMFRQILPVYQLLCQMDPSICQMMVGMFNELTPQLEQQIYTSAIQVGN